MEEASQFSAGQTAQIITCSIMDKPLTGLDDCLNMLLACFRKRMSDYRALSQKGLQYFKENRVWFEGDADPKFGAGSEKEKFVSSDPYKCLSSLLRHSDGKEDSAGGNLWIVMSACFNLRHLQGCIKVI